MGSRVSPRCDLSRSSELGVGDIGGLAVGARLYPRRAVKGVETFVWRDEAPSLRGRVRGESEVYVCAPKDSPFWEQVSKIVCAKSKVIYNVYIMEGKDRPIVMGKKEFEEKEATSGLMVRTTKPLWWAGKVVVVDSGFYVLEGFISMVKKGVFGLALIKKQRYCLKGVPEVEIIRKMQNKEVGDMDAVQASIIGKIYHIMAIKEPD